MERCGLGKDENLVEKTEELIRKAGVDASIIWHREWGRETVSIAKVLGVDVSQIIKCLIFLDPGGRPVMAIVRGDSRVDVSKLCVAAGASELRLAKAKEVEDLTGHPIGGVPPIGLGVRTFVDRLVLEREWVYGSAGSPYAGLRIRSADLVRLSGAVVSEISA